MPGNRRNIAIHQAKLELIHSDAYEEWQLTLNSDETKDNYSNHLAYFCKFHSIKALDLQGMEPDEIKKLVVKYLLHLKKNAVETPGKLKHGELRVNSLIIYMSGVKSWLEHLEKPLPWKKINKMLPEQVMSEIRAYRREEIKQMLSFADFRQRAMIYIMAAGGVRRQVFATLKVSNFEVFDAELGIGLLWVYGRSKKWRYFTLLTPEATKALQDYLKWREEHGERPLAPDAPLIRDKFDVFTSRRLRPKPLKPTSVLRMMERLLQRAGISDHTIAPDHSFRHFFDTMLINSNVNDRMKKYWMGHKAGLGLDTRYYDPRNPDSKKALLIEYLKAVDLLTINDEQRLQREVLKLRKDLLEAAPREIIADVRREMDDIRRELKDALRSGLGAHHGKSGAKANR